MSKMTKTMTHHGLLLCVSGPRIGRANRARSVGAAL